MFTPLDIFARPVLLVLRTLLAQLLPLPVLGLALLPLGGPCRVRLTAAFGWLLPPFLLPGAPRRSCLRALLPLLSARQA